MSDTLLSWHVRYIQGLKSGKSHESILGELQINQENFRQAKIENSAFSAALLVAGAGIGATLVSAEDLGRLRESQADEYECAAFFGMTVESFKSELNKNEKLQAVFDTGPARGKAKIRMAQFDKAVDDGDTTMLKHTGEHVLGQRSVVKHDLIGNIDKAIADAKAQLQQMQVSKQLVNDKVIDAVVVEVDDEEAEKDR